MFSDLIHQMLRIYPHIYRNIFKKNEKNQQKNILSHADNAYLWLVLGFALLQMCWYGADLLPAVQDSMHRYAG